MEKSSVFRIIIAIYFTLFCYSNTFTQSVYYCNATNVNIRAGNCLTSTKFGSVSSPQSYVVLSTFTSSCSDGYNWHRIDIPNAHGEPGYPTTAYVAIDFFTISSSPTNYLTVQNAENGLVIRNNPNSTITWIYNSGHNFNHASFEDGQKIARTPSSPYQDSNGLDTWYEVYLTPNCYAGSNTSSGVKLKGWVSNGISSEGPFVVPPGPCTTISSSYTISDQNVTAPLEASFTLNATGTNITYQWQYSTNGGASWYNIPNSSPYSETTSSNLTINPTAVSMDGYKYRCLLYNNCTQVGYTNWATLDVTSMCTNPATPSNPSSNSPNCGSVTISRNGTVPPNETWYWQGTSCGMSFAYGSASTIPATSSNTYYIRAYNNTEGCWSDDCGSVAVVIKSTPSTPGTPTSNSPQTESVTITRSGNPPSGIKWYWQGISCGTSTSLDSDFPYTATTSGTYYIKAYNTTTGCWSADCGSVDVIIDPCTQPESPPDPTISPQQFGEITITRSGSPASGIKWYWQGISCGTSTSLDSDFPYTATTSGTYYIKAYNTTTGCWSADCGSVDVIINPAIISIDNEASVIPPWQREGDLIEGSLTVDLTNAGINGTWFLQVDYYDENNILIDHIDYPHQPSSITTQHFSTATNSEANSELSAQAKNGRHFKWKAILVSNGASATAEQQTKIIEKKWDKKNVAIYNETGEQLKIPLKYVPNATQVQVIFCRDGGDISSSGNSFSIILPLDNIKRLTSVQSCEITPQLFCLLNSSKNDFCQPVNNIGYFTINVGNDNNLNSVPAGENIYSIYYFNSSDQVISNTSEEGYFELVKVGKVNYSGSNKAVVFIGGWNNDIYSDINSVTNTSDNSQQHWSITKSDRWSNSGYDTYYITQNIIGYSQRNAYDIGIALDKLLEKNPNITEISLVCHSKAGIEVRALLGNYAVSYSNFPSSFYDFAGQTTLFSSFECSSKIKKVAFLATPHNGISFSYTTLGIIAKFGGKVYLGFEFSPAFNELIRYFGYNFIGILNDYGKIPLGIQVANLTAYHSYVSKSLLYSYNNYVSDFTDGVVPGWSSNEIYLTYTDNSPVDVKQMFQESPHLISHSDVHTNKGLHLVSSSTHENMNCIPSNSSNLEKLVTFITGNAQTYNETIPFATCIKPSLSPFSSQSFASVLSGTMISRKLSGDTTFYPLGKTGENGEFNATIIPALQIGDSLKLEATGYETLVLVVDNDIIASNNIAATMLKTNIYTSKIKYPILKLVNQNPITSSSTINLEASGQNVLNYQINSPFNQDTTFVHLSLSSNQFTAALDTGYNLILVRLIGQEDTVALGKEVYFLPDTLLTQNTYNVSITADSASLGTKIYVNNQFVKEINNNTDVIPVLLGKNTFKFTKFGYVDSLVSVDSTSLINIALQLFPHSYSSPTDSNTIDFPLEGKLQYRKNVTMLDDAQSSIISLKQMDDDFSSKGLVPKSRKFEFSHLNSPTWSNIKTAIVLDQIEDLCTDSIYLMKINDDTLFTKIAFDTTVVGAGYDSTVQKLTYNYINFNQGTALKEELVIMKKQAPILHKPDLNMNENDTLFIPLAHFFSDPDKINNDMTYEMVNASSQLSIEIINDTVLIIPQTSWKGMVFFTLKAQHDSLWRYSVNCVKVAMSEQNPGICPGSNELFYSGISDPGNAYQWQVDSGSGFEDITNNIKYSGVENDSITLISPSLNWTGYRYRCAITNNSETTYSQEYSLKFRNIWAGSFSKKWENADNWYCQVLPNRHTDVVVPLSALNFPEVTNTSYCRSLKLDSIATLHVNPDYPLCVGGTIADITCSEDTIIYVDQGINNVQYEYTVNPMEACKGDLMQTSGIASGGIFPLGSTTNCFQLKDDTGVIVGTCCSDVIVISSIGISGSAVPGSIDEETSLTQDANNADIWSAEVILTAGELKFRANNSWSLNWGGDIFPSGTAVVNGNNLTLPVGNTYSVTFNSRTLEYNFIVQCPSNITFTTQAQIDEFPAYYPGCDSISGSVNIEGSDITNLDSLAQITYIGNDLYITNNPVLSNISGLSGLTSTGANIYIYGNQTLTGLSGLNALSSIEGGLRINNNPVLASLVGLSSITTIGGQLYLADNIVLTSLEGINSITTLGGGLSLSNNTALVSLTNFDALTSIGGELYIYNNPALVSLTGLNTVTNIHGQLFIGSNNSLMSLNGLNAITSITYGFSISENVSLTNLAGLNALDSVGAYLNISGNSNLVNLDGLNALVNIGGEFSIHYNNALTNISGLIALTSIGGQLRINNNPLLSICEASSICDYLDSTPNNADIHSNANGCETVDQILLACGNPVICAHNITFNSQAEIDSFPSYYPLCNTITGNLTIRGSDITNLNGLSQITFVGGGINFTNNTIITNLLGLHNLDSVGGNFYLNENPALTSLNGLNALTSVGGYFNIGNNPNLTDLTALNLITSIDGYLSINRNNALLNLNGLNALTSIGAQLTIAENPALTSLNGLNALTTIGGALTINNNDVLPNLSGLNALTSIGGELYIHRNPSLVNLIGLNALSLISEQLRISHNISLSKLSGLNAVTFIGGDIHVNDNPVLTNINGLNAVATLGGGLQIYENASLTSLMSLDLIPSIDFLTIVNNAILSKCEAQAICNYVAIPSNSVNISGNAMGCATRVEIEVECGN